VTTPEDRARRVFGERASFYSDSDCHRDPQVLAMMVELVEPQRDWRMLDVATGTGHTAFAFAGHVRFAAGLDLTPEMVREACRLREREGADNVKFTLGDVRALPFAPEVFDLVTARRAPHHFSDIGGALGEMRRVLRPGGRLLIDDRSVPEDDTIDAIMNELDTLHDPSHVRQYRASEWMHLLEAQGFNVDGIEPYYRHRPLTALTEGMSAAGLERAREILEALTPAQREQMAYTQVQGEWRLNHWYVTIAATRT
jgi:ubiquinone/menaquinone biosynthesis C-methylase UbiE